MKLTPVNVAGYAVVAVVLAAAAAYAYKTLKKPQAAVPPIVTPANPRVPPAPVGYPAVVPPAPKKDQFQQLLDDATSAYSAYQSIKGGG